MYGIKDQFIIFLIRGLFMISNEEYFSFQHGIIALFISNFLFSRHCIIRFIFRRHSFPHIIKWVEMKAPFFFGFSVRLETFSHRAFNLECYFSRMQCSSHVELHPCIVLLDRDHATSSFFRIYPSKTHRRNFSM